MDRPPVTMTYIPAWVCGAHRAAMLGDGDTYKETTNLFMSTVTPSPTDRRIYPDLVGVEAVYLIYKKRRR